MGGHAVTAALLGARWALGPWSPRSPWRLEALPAAAAAAMAEGGSRGEPLALGQGRPGPAGLQWGRPEGAGGRFGA